MADKSFIEFRLDPDNIKEELSQLIPYYETLKYYHENPDAPISETAKVALNETPFIGSLLRGEPVNAAKEAIIMGMPIPSNKYQVYKFSSAVPDYQYKFVKDLHNHNYANINGNVYIDEKGRYYVKSPNSNLGWDINELKPVKMDSDPTRFYDATPADVANTYNEYQFVFDNFSPAKLNKVRRFGGAGEDVQVGNKNYKPLSFYDRYKEVSGEINKLNSKLKKRNLTSNETLKLKQLESEMKMLETADDFTQFGPYLKDDGTNALNNALNDNSKRFIEEDDWYVNMKNPWWVRTMRDWKKSGRYDP